MKKMIVFILCGFVMSGCFSSLESTKLVSMSKIAEIKDKNNRTELMDMSYKGNIKRIKELLKAGANINAIDNQGFTPLINAVSGEQTEAVKLLLNNGANVNARTKHGMTALIGAVKDGNIEMVRALLAKNADKMVKFNGKTLVEIAKNASDTKIVKELQK